MQADQANTLRTLKGNGVRALARNDSAQRTRVIAVASGKGGVGKTNLVANLAVAYARAGRRVLALDGDLGLANLDIALGICPDRTLLDVVDGDARVEDILMEGPEGVRVLPGCSGRYELANMGPRDRHNLFAAVDTLEEHFDLLLIDTGAGIGSNAVDFAGAAETVLIVANSEPTSIADAYGLMKVVNQRSGIKRFHLVANQVKSVAEGEEVYRRLSSLADRFLAVSVDYVGSITADSAVRRSICAGVPLLVKEPKAAAAHCIEEVARKLLETPQDTSEPGGIRLFWKRLVGWRAA